MSPPDKGAFISLLGNKLPFAQGRGAQYEDIGTNFCCYLPIQPLVLPPPLPNPSLSSSAPLPTPTGLQTLVDTVCFGGEAAALLPFVCAIGSFFTTAEHDSVVIQASYLRLDCRFGALVLRKLMEILQL